MIGAHKPANVSGMAGDDVHHVRVVQVGQLVSEALKRRSQV